MRSNSLRRNHLRARLLLALAVGGMVLTTGCRSGTSVAHRERPSPTQAVSEHDRAGSVRETSAIAANTGPQEAELASEAEHSDPPAKTRRFIPDWLRFGDHESVPLPTTLPADSATTEAAAGPGADFQ